MQLQARRSPLRPSPVHVGRLRLHSACINPRDRPREAPPSAMPNAARRRAPRARTAAQGRDGESRVKDWTRPTKKPRGGGGRTAGEEMQGPRSERRSSIISKGCRARATASGTAPVKWTLMTSRQIYSRNLHSHRSISRTGYF